MRRVLCTATVDLRIGGGFIVDVRGGFQGDGPEKEQARTYHMPEAETEDGAAQEGIRRFVEELEAVA